MIPLIVMALWLAAGALVVAWFMAAASARRRAIPGPGEPIRLGGRRFVVCENPSVAQDGLLASLLAAAGLDPFKAIASSDPGESAALAFEAIHRARVMVPMLGCILVPAELAARGRPGWLRRLLERWGLVEPRPRGWTPEVAAETSRFLGELTDPAEKQRIYQLFAGALIPFFVPVTGPSRPSAPSSDAPNGPAESIPAPNSPPVSGPGGV